MSSFPLRPNSFHPRTSDRAPVVNISAARTMPETPVYLEVDNLSKVYASEDGPVRALDRVSLMQQRGEFVSIVGPSGCGKSTLLMIAAGLASSSEGRVLVESKVVNAARTDL